MNHHDRDGWCPSCGNERLKIIERDYHGCGIDIAVCEGCDKTFEISYRIDRVIEVTN